MRMDGWRKVSGSLGTHPGGFYVTPERARYYVKEARSPAHARNEILASRLYALAGVPVVHLEPVRRCGLLVGTASPVVVGARADLWEHLADPAYMARVWAGFAVDAWLANWDVVGEDFDNIVSDAQGRPVRVDVGGSLLFRAMGAPKGDDFGPDVREWETLRDGTNPMTAAVFGAMTPEHLHAAAAQVLTLTTEQISHAVRSVGFDRRTGQGLAAQLLTRRASLARRIDNPTERTDQ